MGFYACLPFATEAKARAALRAFVVGDVERWIAEQRWEAIQDGWRDRR